VWNRDDEEWAYCAASPALLLCLSGITRRLLPIPFNVIQRSCMFTSQLGPTLRQMLTLVASFSSRTPICTRFNDQLLFHTLKVRHMFQTRPLLFPSHLKSKPMASRIHQTVRKWANGTPCVWWANPWLRLELRKPKLTSRTVEDILIWPA
jgi:hypothetical protein